MPHDFSQLGYCTNVHAGADLATTRANLERYALAVKAKVSPHAPMGVGLWLSAKAARSLIADGQLQAFGDWLGSVGLVPYTFNGFPYGDFHQTVVKHRVYEPTWWEKERLQYTLDLIDIQHALLPAGMAGSISTSPIAWGSPPPARGQLAQAAENICSVAERLERLEHEQGRSICLCFEPEPGCVFQYSSDIVRFFKDHLLLGGKESTTRRFIKVCHDVCHAVVMFEEQADVFRAYQSAGIGVGKVQISSAVVTPVWEELPARRLTLAQLATFREERYLHQTIILPGPRDPLSFFEDLPLALAAAGSEEGLAKGQWAVHFHVPVYLERFGRLAGSRQAILDCLAAARQYSDVRHFEVETYAWGVLPPELQQPDLAAGIAAELQWFVSVQEKGTQ